MTIHRLAVAGRYQERHAIAELLRAAQLDQLPVEITASWLGTAEGDADLTDEQAVLRANINRGEIARADALLYVPSWFPNTYCFQPPDTPRWSPGRLIDVGIAFACRIPIIVIGRPEPSIYFRGELVTLCEAGTLRETVQHVLNL